MDSDDDNDRCDPSKNAAGRRSFVVTPVEFSPTAAPLTRQPLSHLNRAQLRAIKRIDERINLATRRAERGNFISRLLGEVKAHAPWRLSEIRNLNHDHADGGIFVASAIQHTERETLGFSGDIPR